MAYVTTCNLINFLITQIKLELIKTPTVYPETIKNIKSVIVGICS